MEQITKDQPQRLSFSSIEPRLQLAWDSTSLGALKTCPRYYKYSILDGYVTHAESIHLRFGLEYHSAMEHYHRQRAKGIDYNAAVISTIRHVLNSTWDYKLGRPWTSDMTNKTRETLVRSIVWYMVQYKDDPCETVMLKNGQPAVELSFRFELGLETTITHEQYTLCGHIDRGVTFAGGVWVKDYKTTKSDLNEKFFDQFMPENQMSLYDNAGNIIFFEENTFKGVIIDGARILVNSSQFQRQTITRTQKQREEWLKDLLFFLRQNEQYVANDYWPMNDKACNNYGGCPYRSVCSASPDVRPMILKELYGHRSWDPLVTREI